MGEPGLTDLAVAVAPGAHPGPVGRLWDALAGRPKWPASAPAAMRALPAALALSLLLSGCASGGGEAGTQDALQAAIDDVEVEASATTGAIRGVVVDDAIRPLAEVTVRLQGAGVEQETATRASGAFGFSNLEPGTYFVTAHRFGYNDARQSVEVVAGVADPPATKLQLTIVTGLLAYVEQYKWEGYMQCGTNNVILCAGPNAGSQVACALSKGQPPSPAPPTPPFPAPACLGNLTNDQFSIWHGVSANLTLIQSEMVWDSTQALGDSLNLLLRKGSREEFDSGFYNGSLNSSSGPSPVTARANAEDMEDADLGIHNGLVIAIFPGRTSAAPVPFGAAVSQTWTVYTHAFHGYLPPDEWRFVDSGAVPPPE